jgi:hypothetical protein
MKSYILSASVLALAVASSAAPAAADEAVHVRGTITIVTASSFTVATAKGPVEVAVSPDVKFTGALPATIADIKPGTFIGSANVGSSGAARALEVVVFPAAMKGTGEGDYPWDLPAPGGAHSAMTNGTVGAPHMSSMTNATVTGMSTGATHVFSVSYKGGTKRIAVAPNTPIVRIEPGTKALLHDGAHVFVVAIPSEGAMSARVVVVGEHGAVPPM